MATTTPRLIPPLTGIYPGPHTLKIEEFFRGRSIGEGSDVAPLEGIARVRHAYFICFTNRCGSNFVAEAIASSGQCTRAGELLNHDQVIRQSTQRGFTSYRQYLSWRIRRGAAESGIFGCKVSPDQLLHLYNLGVLDQLAGRLTFIHVTRDDVVRQAVSMLRASTTKQWTSEQTAIKKTVKYDPNALVRILFNLEQANAVFRGLFHLLQVNPLTIRYEEFVAMPEVFVARVGEKIGLPTLAIQHDALKWKKQANSENETLRERLLAEFELGAARPRVDPKDRRLNTCLAKVLNRVETA